jgi:hypothetical protein
VVDWKADPNGGCVPGAGGPIFARGDAEDFAVREGPRNDQTSRSDLSLCRLVGLRVRATASTLRLPTPEPEKER